MTSLSTRLKGRSELGVAALLGAAGALVLLDAARLVMPYSQSDPGGPQDPAHHRGSPPARLRRHAGSQRPAGRPRRGRSRRGRRPDPPRDWKTVLPLAGAFIANILLIDWAGWVISGTVLFWGSVWALGSRHYVRDGLISLALALLTFYGFYLGLGIALPAGLLEGIL